MMSRRRASCLFLVHGDEFGQDPNQLSLNSLFLSGKQQFAHVFERETVHHGWCDASTNELLVLKGSASPSEECAICCQRRMHLGALHQFEYIKR
jgi:hypothetical protein